MATTLEHLQHHIAEALSEMDNTDYYYLMLQLAEWAQAEADLACLNWRGLTDAGQTDCDDESGTPLDNPLNNP